MRSIGTTSMTRSIPTDCGRRRRLGLSGLRTRHRAPGASPRRSGWTPETPGHQSARLWGAAGNGQKAAIGGASVRSAAYRGKELLPAEHPLEFGLTLGLVEPLDAR